MLKVYIEGSAFSTPQPVEVSSEAPIAQVLPALVKELHLPTTDASGNHLVYFLRHAADGRVLPGNFTLLSAGIYAEDLLSLESYTHDPAPVPAVFASQHTNQPASFYSDRTIADSSAFVEVSNSAPLVLAAPPVQQAFVPDAQPVVAPPARARRWPRRLFLLAGGAILATVGAGVAYAAYQTFSSTSTYFASSPVKPSTPAAKTTNIATPTQVSLPTHASSLFVFTGHQQAVRAVSWAPNGTQLASGANDRQVLVWNLNGQILLRKKQNSSVRAVVWSPDSARLALAANNQVIFLNAQSGATEARQTHTHRAAVTTLAWSQRQPQFLVSAGLDELAVVWNTQTFQPQTFFRQHTAGILSASWASDGQTVGTSSLGGVVRIWNGPDGQQVHGFYQDGAIAMNALAFAPNDSRLAVGGADSVLRLWQNGLACQMEGNGDAAGQCLDAPQHLAGHTQAIRALAWSPDGRLLASAGDDGLLLIWYPAQSSVPLLKVPHNAPVLAVSWSPDGEKIATAAGNTVTLWMLS
jgi:hypothetical protein